MLDVLAVSKPPPTSRPLHFKDSLKSSPNLPSWQSESQPWEDRPTFPPPLAYVFIQDAIIPDLCSKDFAHNTSSLGGNINCCYDPTAFPPLTAVEVAPNQWKVQDQKDSKITKIIHPSNTDLDEFDPLPSGLALLAFRAARILVILCHSIYPSWKKLSTPITADFFLRSRYWAPPLAGGQRIPKLSTITKRLKPDVPSLEPRNQRRSERFSPF